MVITEVGGQYQIAQNQNRRCATDVTISNVNENGLTIQFKGPTSSEEFVWNKDGRNYFLDETLVDIQGADPISVTDINKGWTNKSRYSNWDDAHEIDGAKYVDQSNYEFTDGVFKQKYREVELSTLNTANPTVKNEWDKGVLARFIKTSSGITMVMPVTMPIADESGPKMHNTYLSV